MATTEVTWTVRDDTNQLIHHESISVESTHEYVYREQLRHEDGGVVIWDKSEMDALLYEADDVLIAPKNCDAVLTVGIMSLTIPSGSWFYILIGGSPADALCAVTSEQGGEALTDVIIRGHLEETA